MYEKDNYIEGQWAGVDPKCKRRKRNDNYTKDYWEGVEPNQEFMEIISTLFYFILFIYLFYYSKIKHSNHQ